ncbi:hypothetical protein QUW02_03835 [Bacteroides eggerthii]|uniref:Cell surface protein n=1 Tax=Bacteroides eggerthii TaxID=28111 RepID=A0ABT7U3H2_9BACE|nr:hypothetical protein [Bacteroides eggerthii]
MKKNFIKVSVICALTLASSTAVVSCSDYDDDIKNQQEQIDALKKQLDASKTEITEGLNSAIEGLKAEITEIAGSKADAASVQALEQKAAELQQALDSKASNEQIAALSEEVKGLINNVNSELSAAMEGQKAELENQIKALQAKQDELNQKIEGLDNSQEISEIQGQLGTISASLAEAQNDLKTILDANYGEKITDLQQRVTNLEGLKTELENYTDEAIKNLKPEITAEIQAAINGVKELIPENLDSRLTTLEEKIANYVTANDLQAEVEALESLINTKEEGLRALIDGKVSQNDFNTLKDKVEALEGEIVSSEAIDEKIKTEIKALRDDVKKLLGVMVQSIMYVPQFDSNLQPTQVTFNTLYAQPKTGGSKAKVADNVTSKVQFRVTPASAAASFKDNYKIAFEGKWIGATRAAQPNYLNAEYVADADAEAKGIVTFNVSRSSEFAAGQAYALCAHITAINEEGKTENLTDISSDFFVSSHSDITVNNIEVVAPNFNGAKTVAWNDTKTSFTPGTVTLKGTKVGGGTINDLASIFGADKFAVKYALTGTGANAFQIDANTGEIKVKSASSSAINSKAGVKATATAAGVSYETTFKQASFEITKDIKTYSETVNVNWLTIATQKITVDLLDAAHKTKIADAFGISTNDWANIVGTAQIDDNLGSVSGVTLTKTGGALSLEIAQLTHIAADKVVTITLKDKTASGTTQSSSEYEIKLTIKATQYVDDKLNLTKQEAVWDNNRVTLTPTFKTGQSGKITQMNLNVDVTSIYKNFTDDITNIHNNYAHVTIVAPTNTVTGVTKANYNSKTATSDENKTMKIDQATYAGGATIQAQTKFVYNNNQVVNSKTQNFTFGVQQLSGTFVNEAPAEVKFGSKNESKQLTGLSWKDYLNRVMWVDGKKQIYDAQSMPNAAFAVDPFSNNIYAMAGSVPTYSIEQDNNYLNVNENTGVITLTEEGKNKAFANDYTATLVVTINQPRWGAINGLGTAQNGKYKLTFKVVIPKGIQ